MKIKCIQNNTHTTTQQTEHIHSMFHIRNIRNICNIRSFTKSVKPVNVNNALMLVKHQLRSSEHDNNNADDDMANMATARRFIDDYMRRIESGGEKKEQQGKKKEDCAENFKCEITRRYKRGGEVDCKCKLVCMANISETMLIHEEANRDKEKI